MLHLRSWDINMAINQYKVIITPTAYKEIDHIYNYISENLYAENAAIELMRKIEEKIQKLKYAPKIHTEIEKINGLKRRYRRIVIKNFVILYTINEEEKIVYVSHIYYGRQNYLNLL